MVIKKKNHTDSIQQKKKQSLISTLIFIGIIVLLNIIAQFRFLRFDLTQDKRYTLGHATKELLNDLDDQVYIRIYLEGELPAGFRRLKESTKELLDEMRAVSGKRIDYEFIDPMKDISAKDEEGIYNQLINEGLEPVNLEVVTKDNKTQKIIFPGAVVYYKGRSLPIKLLKQQIGVAPDQVLHNSIIGLEYDFVNTIKKLSESKRKKIAFIEGHGELNEKETWDIQKSLEEYYDVSRINLPIYKVGILDSLDLLIIAKPRSTFSELDKYKIDQFVVRGGKVLWLLEQLQAEIDSLTETGSATSIAYDLNLNDMLFKYGIRINYNLVQDLQCHYIPVLIDMGTPQQDFRPWLYYPLVFPILNHPIVNNLNAIWFRFASSMDTVGNPRIKKTPLLLSSETSRLAYNPVQISILDAHREPNPELFDKSFQMLSVLVEGSFPSIYKNRLSAETLKTGEYGEFREQGKPTKMIFISDGDVIANQVSKIREQYFPLGYDRFTNQTFGNKTFVLNAIDYLIDDSDILQLRSKQFKLRLLNSTKVEKEKVKWQIINLVLPVIFILLFGYIFTFIRKKRFSFISKTQNTYEEKERY